MVLVTRKPEDKGQAVTSPEAKAAVSQAKVQLQAPARALADLNRPDVIDSESTMNPTEIALRAALAD